MKEEGCREGGGRREGGRLYLFQRVLCIYRAGTCSY